MGPKFLRLHSGHCFHLGRVLIHKGCHSASVYHIFDNIPFSVVSEANLSGSEEPIVKFSVIL